MAIRNVLTKEEAALYKKSRIITKFDDRLHQLLDDMADTLIESNGVGLAAPQVGILRRAVLVLETNVAEDEDEYIIELINPEIIETAGEEEGPEGCLSVPGEYGLVVRPTYVKVRAQDRFGEWFEVEGEGLTARAFCHEIDHLEGVLYISKCTRMLSEDEIKTEDDEE
ncbi:MAG: peptide deformylase [Oscillospiraceae bacterium]|nr:peptide deformylase [Oscillospiraceae bacterium]